MQEIKIKGSSVENTLRLLEMFNKLKMKGGGKR
jgi:hypothetical protein